MRITFYGASGCVTGSSYLLEHDGFRLLVDAGLCQGSDEKIVGNELPFNASDIDAVILTHAHIDHSGRIPLLVKEGFKGNIYSTSATRRLCNIMLLDSANIQESEAEWKNRKRARSGQDPIKPLYRAEDAVKSLELFCDVPYGRETRLSSTLSFTLYDAGHLLGSASIKILYMEKGEKKSIVFSGDIGNTSQPILNDPVYIKGADYVVMESTYGDRNHEVATIDESFAIASKAKELAGIVDETFKKGGNLVIPSFAVGRTQEILYLFRIIWDKKLLPYSVPVYLDSPLSSKATEVFSSCLRESYFDKDAMELIKRGINPVSFPTLVMVEKIEDSKALNSMPESKVIISSSGMCEAGRIRHHLKHNLWRKESTVLFVGYQAEGTLGRKLVEGTENVTLFGEKIEVKASIKTLPGTSGHADQAGLLKWLGRIGGDIKHVFVVHGEENVSRYFAYRINEELKIEANAPSFLSSYVLGTDKLEKERKIELEDRSEMDIKSGLSYLKKKRSELDSLIEMIEMKASSSDKLSLKEKQIISRRIIQMADDISNLEEKWEEKKKANP